MTEPELPIGARRKSVFPAGIDTVLKSLAFIAIAGVVYVVFLIDYGLSARTISTGYMPHQPLPYSHRLHAGELGIDCRYCHTDVEKNARANIPPTGTCMNCHSTIVPQSEKLDLVWESYQEGTAIRWVRVHDLPDYVYFDHGAHVSHGIGCASCHGRVDRMDEVYQVEPLSMGWCLDCHRDPAPHLRPPGRATDMDYEPDVETGRRLLAERGFDESRVRELTSCSTCHR